MAIVLLPLIVTSSEPLLPPGHCFGLSGFVVSAAGKPVEDYAVVIFGRGGDLPSEWIRLDCCGMGSGLDLTGDRGRYRVAACPGVVPDSIAAAVVLPDTTIMSLPVGTADLYVTEEEEPFTEDGFLCDDTGWRVVNYHHESVDSVIVPVP